MTKPLSGAENVVAGWLGQPIPFENPKPRRKQHRKTRRKRHLRLVVGAEESARENRAESLRRAIESK